MISDWGLETYRRIDVNQVGFDILFVFTFVFRAAGGRGWGWGGFTTNEKEMILLISSVLMNAG